VSKDEFITPGECHMSGNGKQYWKLLAGIAALGLASLACVVVQQVQKFDCEASGGQWKEDSYGEYNLGYYCENAGPEYIQKYFPTATPIASSTLDTSATQETSPSTDNKTCDATRYLQVSSEITLQETNQFGTRACEYRLNIRNTDPDSAIRFYVYQHDQDGYANTEKSHWMGNVLVEPGEEGEWTGSIYIYTDEDANGPVMSIPEKLAGVFDAPECTEAKQDESFFEQVFIPLDPVCPME
jgi:hypothetical protein